MRAVVVGGGVVGMSIAYELSCHGADVTVLERRTVGSEASAGNAGWITPFLSTPRAAPGAVRDAVKSFSSPHGPARMRPHAELGFAQWVARFLISSSRRRSSVAEAALQRLGQNAIGAFDSLIERGVEFDHYSAGLAVVFKEQVSLEHYRDVVARVRGFGYPGTCSEYRGADIVDFDPAIRRSVAGVLHLEDERHVRPETLTAGLAKAFVASGGTVLEHECVQHVVRTRPSPAVATWRVTTDGGQVFEADRVVIAAGVASKAILRPLGVKVPLEAAKGTSLTARGQGTVPRHALKMYEDMVACSPFGDALRLSGTFDLGRRDDVLNRRRLNMVTRRGLTYLEDWRPTDVELEWVGHRPTTVDDLPIIGSVPGHEGLYLATGHGTLGVTLGPLTGALAARELCGRGDQELLAPFRLDRFVPARRRARDGASYGYTAGQSQKSSREQGASQ